MLNAAFLSYWHVHAHDYSREFLSLPGTRIAAIWDEVEERGRAAAAKYGAAFYPTVDEALAHPGVACAVVDAPTSLHPEVLIKCARAKRHIFTEKVLAMTTAEADDIVSAVREAGVQFMISFPRRTEPQWMAVKQIADSGALGRITYVRARWAHDGASARWLPEHFYNPVQCGGGALIDLGAHPMYLARWIMGRPETVSARYGHVLTESVEDNAVVTLHYSNGALAVVEAGFVSLGSALMEVHGTEGLLYAGFPGYPVSVRSRVWNRTLGADGWVCPNLPARDRTPMQQWVDAIRDGKPAGITLEDARDLTELMEAANRSATEGRPTAPRSSLK